MPGVGDQFRVGWMIDRLDADDILHQPGGVLVDVFDQFVLGVARPGYQDRAGIHNRSDDGLKEMVVLGRVPAADRVRFVVDMPRRMVRVQHQPFDLVGTELEHAGFVVIDPDDRVEVTMNRHEILSF
jgi:hypothetical protein